MKASDNLNVMILSLKSVSNVQQTNHLDKCHQCCALLKVARFIDKLTTSDESSAQISEANNQHVHMRPSTREIVKNISVTKFYPLSTCLAEQMDSKNKDKPQELIQASLIKLWNGTRYMRFAWLSTFWSHGKDVWQTV